MKFNVLLLFILVSASAVCQTHYKFNTVRKYRVERPGFNYERVIYTNSENPNYNLTVNLLKDLRAILVDNDRKISVTYKLTENPKAVENFDLQYMWTEPNAIKTSGEYKPVYRKIAEDSLSGTFIIENYKSPNNKKLVGYTEIKMLKPYKLTNGTTYFNSIEMAKMGPLPIEGVIDSYKSSSTKGKIYLASKLLLSSPVDFAITVENAQLKSTNFK